MTSYLPTRAVAEETELSQAQPGGQLPSFGARHTRRRRVWATNRKCAFGLLLLGLIAAAAAAAPLLTSQDPSAMSALGGAAPSLKHLFGTNQQGQDIFAQVLYGGRNSLLIAGAAAAISTVLAVALGVTAAYVGGFLDDLISLLCNVFLVLPALVVLIVVATYLPTRGPSVMVLLIAGFAWAGEARVLRSQALTLRNRDFIVAAKSSGEYLWRIVFREIVPNMISRIAAAFIGCFVFAIIYEASLEFLGFGSPSSITWGNTLFWAQNNAALETGQWWHFVFPGMAIALTATALIFINYGIDEISNPRLRTASLRAETRSANVRHRFRSNPAATTPRPAAARPGALVEIQELVVEYPAQNSGRIRAVDRVSLSIQPGEIVGLAGESGCGKSTLALSTLRLLKPPTEVSGRILFDGRDVLAMASDELRGYRWRRIAMVFQSAMSSLNPVLRVSDQFVDMLRTHERMTRAEARRRAGDLLGVVGLDRAHLHSYPHELSGGMKQRVVTAMAVALRPELLILDEPTTALDVVVQREIMEEIAHMQADFGFAVLFITHDLALLAEFSDRIGIMYAGEIVELATTEELFSSPKHPYTVGLMESFLSVHGDTQRVNGIPGFPPELNAALPGCRFAPRCTRAFSRCRTVHPALEQIGVNTQCACHLYRVDE